MPTAPSDLYAECQRLYQHNQALYTRFFRDCLRYQELNARHAAHHQQLLARYHEQRQRFEEQQARTQLSYMVQ
jgi:hypothetical protein